MKRILLIVCSFLVLTATDAQKRNKKSKKAQQKEVSVPKQAQVSTAAPALQAAPTDINQVLEFTETDHDMGKIVFNKPLEYNVTAKVIGNQPVKIENISAGCGCTTPKWEKGRTYQPGESIKITLGYSANVLGAFRKSATAVFSGGLSKVLQFHGETFAASK